MSVLINTIPFLMLLLFPVVAFLILRFLAERWQHHERMTAIQKGVVDPGVLSNTLPNRTYLLRGLIWIAGGLGLAAVILVFALVAATERGPVQDLEKQLQREKYLKELGASDQQLREMERKLREQQSLRFGPEAMAVIGLVPVAVGGAYLTFFFLEEKRLREKSPSS
jgi:hypothetical protein